jgi:sialate O-acetylesterase
MFTWTYFCIFILFTHFANGGNELKRIIDLDNYWRFEIGDDLRWAKTDYDDCSWEQIKIPSTWEDEGFPGYDGYAWYRIRFTIDPIYQEEVLYLIFGAIDDADEVYLNGHFIGYKGTFPPGFVTQAHFDRQYRLNNTYLNFGSENVLAVRVFDAGGVGGIKSGKNGIYVAMDAFKLDLDLSGFWRFRTGDDLNYAQPDYIDTDWRKVPVPAYWSSYGLHNYDGFVWYRKHFIVSDNFSDKQLILLLGKIDDIDEAYFNGQRIGGTGKIFSDPAKIVIDDQAWRAVRAYTIPSNIINIGEYNSIAIRVFDGTIYGGIYDGPIGITTRERYLNWQKSKSKKTKSFFDLLFD